MSKTSASGSSPSVPNGPPLSTRTSEMTHCCLNFFTQLSTSSNCLGSTPHKSCMLPFFAGLHLASPAHFLQDLFKVPGADSPAWKSKSDWPRATTHNGYVGHAACIHCALQCALQCAFSLHGYSHYGHSSPTNLSSLRSSSSKRSKQAFTS